MNRLLLAFTLMVGLTALAYAGSATLTWTQPAPDATHSAPASYNVYRSTDATVCGGTAPLPGPAYATDPVTILTFTDSNVPALNGTVCYEVEAVNAGGTARSNRVSKTTTVNPPLAPVLAMQ